MFEFAQNIGIGMLDSTICDIYLVDEVGNLLGRPILTACVDAYSQLCCGFALTWEGGMISLRKLMENVITVVELKCDKASMMLLLRSRTRNYLMHLVIVVISCFSVSIFIETVWSISVLLKGYKCPHRIMIE